MDINLTSPIVANISLIQPWWSPLINAGSGLIGAIIGASTALYASYLMRESEERRYERDKQIESLDKRKDQYSRSLTALSTMSVSMAEANPRDLADLILLGDERIDKVFFDLQKIKDQSKWNSKDYKELTSKLIIVMRESIKQIEKEIAELQTPKKHWWQS